MSKTALWARKSQLIQHTVTVSPGLRSSRQVSGLYGLVFSICERAMLSDVEADQPITDDGSAHSSSSAEGRMSTQNP